MKLDELRQLIEEEDMMMGFNEELWVELWVESSCTGSSSATEKKQRQSRNATKSTRTRPEELRR